MSTLLTADDIRDVNRRYHDDAASSYDSKWAVGFGDVWRSQVETKVHKLAGSGCHFHSALEIGAGTGYFGLNLLQSGVIDRLTCSDISEGMLKELRANAGKLELTVDTVTCEGPYLPFKDETFDLVCGHAILHHLPEIERSLKDFLRVLRPGGVILFAGEPSANGDRIATIPKLIGRTAAPAWRTILGLPKANAPYPEAVDRLEALVDVHAFSALELEAQLKAAGFTKIDVRGEELVANCFGWVNRSLEATTASTALPLWWSKFASRGYLSLQQVDKLLERVLPRGLFYNILLSASKPFETPKEK